MYKFYHLWKLYQYWRYLKLKQISKSIKKNIQKALFYTPTKKYEFQLSSANNEPNSNTTDEVTNILPVNQKISQNIDVNLEYIRIKYNYLINNDISIREFTLYAKNKAYQAFLLYIDGMVNTADLNEFILKPLMFKNKDIVFEKKQKLAKSNNLSIKNVKKFNLENYIFNSLLPQNSVKKCKLFSEIVTGINMGNTALFIDTLNIAFNIDLKGFEHRTISKPENEVVIRGSQEGFVEVIRTNTALLRRILNTEDLIIEETSVGKITKTRVAICYMKSIAHNDLVAEVKYRINNLDIDSIISSGQLEKLIQDKPNSLFPQMLLTERPDRAANNLLEGRVVVIVNGTPYALIMPSILMDFLTSPEDINLKYQYSNLLRIIRIFSLVLTMLLPGFYVAITSFHNELIPTELLFAMAAAREKVPFPVIVELIIMEFSFELIREAGVRVPGPIGPTIGIVGALILGEAAVSANVVSPILIIIVAITAICSFAIPDYSFSFALRIYRFLYIILAYLAGFLGIALGIFLHIIVLSGLQSFGVAYLTNHIFININKREPNFFPSPSYMEEERSGFLNTKRPFKQDHISRRWNNSKKDI